MNKPKLSEKNVKCKILPKFEKKVFFMEYILTNFMLYARGNFNNVTIYLATHSHSALVFRLRCISIARKKILHLHEELKHMTIVRNFFTFL
jgi:hypothetical protein